MTNGKRNKKITIDELAVMVQKGFDYIHENMVTKEEFRKLDKRVGRIEEILILDHYPRIRALEKTVGIEN